MNDTSGGGGQQRKRSANQDMQTGSGLTRYRSAPSSYFTNLLSSPAAGGDTDGFGADDFAQLFNPRASSPETQRIFSRFMNSSPAADYAPPPPQPQFLPPPKHEPEPSGAGEYSSSSSAQYHHPGQTSEENLQNEAWNSYTSAQIKMEGGAGNPGLIRHSSSPAGLISDINIEAVRFNSPMDFSSKSKHYTSSGMMPPTVENDPSDDHRGSDGIFATDYINQWDNFLDGPSDKDSKRIANSDGTSDQGNEGWNRPATLLSHHLSLPANMSADLSMEKLLQDSVPCKIRAKRGCATHPRSIAERVRRTKISDRIRKLQELVPNMEKQTNTSDMLDLAVDYIKDLQNQVKTLSDNREKCSCPAKHMP